MWQAALVIGAGVVGVVAAISVAAYHSWQQQQQRHQYRREQTPVQPPAPRIVILGPCSICEGDVNTITGFQLTCNHYMHHTCVVGITRSSTGQSRTIQLTDVCRTCVTSRINKEASTRSRKNEGLRNRGINRQICADCRINFVDNDETRDLACNRHRVHTICWEAIVDSGFTTCPMCMAEM